MKRSSRHLIERYYNKLTQDFDTNKRVIDEVAVVQTKASAPRRPGPAARASRAPCAAFSSLVPGDSSRPPSPQRLRNKIAGFTTHLMKRIQRGPVRGISLKLQEEERERRLDFLPETSAIQTENIEVRQPRRGPGSEEGPRATRAVGGLHLCMWFTHRLSGAQVDRDTLDMLRAMNMGSLPGVENQRFRGAFRRRQQE